MKIERNEITISELKRQLECLEKKGMGDFAVWYRDYNSMDYKLEEGLWDICREQKTVALA